MTSSEVPTTRGAPDSTCLMLRTIHLLQVVYCAAAVIIMHEALYRRARDRSDVARRLAATSP